MADRAARPLDSVASDVLELLTREFMRRGHSVDDMVRKCEEVARDYQPPVLHEGRIEGISRDNWLHIPDLWSMDPDYVDEEGRPLPLPVEGPAPSLEDLHRRVGSKLGLMEVRRQMLASGAAKEEAGRLVAAAHTPILFPAGSAEQIDHHMHFVHSALLNVEHNSDPPAGVRWVERFAVCRAFPISALGPYSNSAKERAEEFLIRESAAMQRLASSAPSEGLSAEATLHVFYSARAKEGSAARMTEAPGQPARTDGPTTYDELGKPAS